MHTDGEVLSVATDAAGAVGFAGTAGGSIVRWRIAAGAGSEPLRTGLAPVLALVAGNTGALLVGCEDGTLGLYTPDGTWHACGRRERGPLKAVAFAGGDRAVSAALDGECVIWELPMLSPVARLPGVHGTVLAIAGAPDADRLLAATLEGDLEVIELDTPPRRRSIAHHSRSLLSLAVAGDARITVSGTSDGRVCAWNTDDVMRGPTSVLVSPALEPAARAAALSGDGRRAVIADAREPVLAMWQVLPDRRRLGTAPVFATALAMDWTGDAAMIGVRDGGWCRLRGPALTLEDDPADDRPRIVQIATSGDGAISAVITVSRLLEIRGRTSREVYRPSASGVRVVAISRDGSTLAAGDGDSTLHICTLAERGHAQLACGAGPILAVAISPDGARVVAGTEHGKLTLWTRTAPHVLLDGKHPSNRGWITALAIPDAGPFVAAGWTSGLIELWNTTTGTRVAEFVAEAEILALGAAESDAIVAIDGSGRMHVLDFAS